MAPGSLRPHLAIALPIAAAALLGLIATAGEATAGSAECGKPGKPPCPMQAWMRSKLSAPYAKKEWTKLASALDQLVGLNPQPKKWGNWKKFCRDGAEASRAGRKDGALASCTSCHQVYRRAYNVAHRKRPVH
jgi:hypothetical protein